MALTDESGSIPATMLVSPSNFGGGIPYPVYMNGGMGGNGGFGDGNGWWVILLILLLAGGWNNNGNGGFIGGNNNNDLYPWMNQANLTSNGFQNQMLNDNVTSIRDGIANLSTQLCNCCGDMQMAMANGFAGVEQGANARQMASMQQAFAAQTAMSQGFNDIGLQLCQASGDNRLATANLGADIAREACATRTSDTQNTQIILNAINDGFRLMSDQRYQDKIDAKNDEIAQLRQENLYARGQASQIAQDARIIDGVYDRLSQCPVDTTPVYGRQPIFTCPQNNNNGCGCGCGNF